MKRTCKLWFSPMIVVCLALSATSTRAQLTVTNNLVMWLKADALSLNNGDPVTNWADSSTNANNASQQTLADQPTFVTNALNGLPAVRFDGASDFLAVTNKIDVFGSRRVHLPNGLTYFAVFITTNSVAHGGADPHGGGNNAPFTIIGDNSSFTESSFGLDGGKGQYTYFDGPLRRLNGTSTVSDNKAHDLIGTHSTSGSANIFTDGLLQGSSNFTYNATFTGFNRIGGGAGGAVIFTTTYDFFQGDLAEVLIYGSVLTGAERGDIHEYLVAKYAIPEPATVSLFILGGLALLRRRVK